MLWKKYKIPKSNKKGFDSMQEFKGNCKDNKSLVLRIRTISWRSYPNEPGCVQFFSSNKKSRWWETWVAVILIVVIHFSISYFGSDEKKAEKEELIRLHRPFLETRPVVDFINVKRTNISYEMSFRQLFSSYIKKQRSYKKIVR